jgi:hypothetical protein
VLAAYATAILYNSYSYFPSNRFNSLAVNPLEVAKAQTKSQTTTDQQLGRPAPSQEQYKAAKVHEKQVEDFELRYSFESHGYALVVFESSKRYGGHSMISVRSTCWRLTCFCLV